MKKERFSIILLGYFLITNSILFILILFALGDYWKINGSLILPSMILFSVFLVLLNSYVFVILSTYLNLPKKFDSIKNKIASEKYNDVDAFQKDVASLLIEAFQAPGANIIGGVFHLSNSSKLVINMKSIVPESIIISNTVHTFKTKIKNDSLFIPVIFEGKNLGYITLMFSSVCMPYTKIMLLDFVEYYLDDQLMILLLLLRNNTNN
jgi:hypothetical protein